MEVLLGLAGLFLVSFVSFLASVRFPSIAKIIWIALFLRVSAALVNFFVIPLPDSSADALTFERLAWEFSKDGLHSALLSFTGPHHNFISWFISLFYSVLGRSSLFAQSVSVFFGMGAVLMGWLISREVWCENSAKKVAFVMALFPAHILYSALVLREAYIVFGILLGLYGLIKLNKEFSLGLVLLSLSGFLFAGFFHGVLFLSVAFIIPVLVRHFLGSDLSNLFSRRKFLLLSALVVITYVSTPYLKKIEIPYIGTVESVSFNRISDKITDRTTTTTINGASYPDWTIPKTFSEALYLMPARVAYFLYSPYSWDVKKYRHIIGYMDSLLYLLFSVFVVISWPYIKNNKGALLVALFAIFFIVIFSYGVGNFGTGIRHRAKFAFLFIILSGPLLRKFKIK